MVSKPAAIIRERVVLRQLPRKSVAHVPEEAASILGEYLPVAPSMLFPDMLSCPLFYHVIGPHEILRRSKQVNGNWSIYFDPSDGSPFSEPGWWIIEEDFGRNGLFWARGGPDKVPRNGWQCRGYLGYYEVCLSALPAEEVWGPGGKPNNDNSYVMNLLGTGTERVLRGVETLVDKAAARIETYQNEARIAEDSKNEEILRLQNELHSIREAYEHIETYQNEARIAEERKNEEILRLQKELHSIREAYEQQNKLVELADKQKQEIADLQEELRRVSKNYKQQILDLRDELSSPGDVCGHHRDALPDMEKKELFSPAPAPAQARAQINSRKIDNLAERYDQEIQALRDEIETVASLQACKLSSQLASIYEQQIASLQAQLSESPQLQNEPADMAEIHKQEIARLENELVSIQSLLQQQTQAHKDAVDEVGRLRQELASTTEAYDKDVALLQSELSKVADMQQASQDMSSMLERQQQQISSLESQLADARVALDQAAQSKEEALEEANKSATKEQGVLLRHVVKIEAKLERQTEAGKEAQEEAEKIRGQLAALEASTAEQRDASDRTASEFLQTIEQLRGELAEAAAKEIEDMPNVGAKLIQQTNVQEGPQLAPTVLPQRNIVHAGTVVLSRVEKQDRAGASPMRSASSVALGGAVLSPRMVDASSVALGGAGLSPRMVDASSVALGGAVLSPRMVDASSVALGGAVLSPRMMQQRDPRYSIPKVSVVRALEAVMQQQSGAAGLIASQTGQFGSGLPQAGSEIEGSPRSRTRKSCACI